MAIDSGEVARHFGPRSTTSRAFSMAAVILARFRMMPESLSSRVTSSSVKAATLPGSNPAKVLPLAEDGGPGQPGLERLEGHPLVEPLHAGDRPALLIVVRGQIFRG
jgi:hypothetical protein